jgi:hypothetical protein
MQKLDFGILALLLIQIKEEVGGIKYQLLRNLFPAS